MNKQGLGFLTLYVTQGTDWASGERQSKYLQLSVFCARLRSLGAGKIAQWLTALAALTGEPSSVPSIYRAVHKRLSLQFLEI